MSVNKYAILIINHQLYFNMVRLQIICVCLMISKLVLDLQVGINWALSVKFELFKNAV